MNPRRSSPATPNATPVMMTMAAASSRYWSEPAVDSPLTVENTRTAEADVPATTRWRLLPNTAYSPSDASSV